MHKEGCEGGAVHPPNLPKQKRKEIVNLFGIGESCFLYYHSKIKNKNKNTHAHTPTPTTNNLLACLSKQES